MQLNHAAGPCHSRIIVSFLVDDFGNEIHVRAPFVPPEEGFFEMEIDTESFHLLFEMLFGVDFD